jgi:hypothetical protein
MHTGFVSARIFASTTENQKFIGKDYPAVIRLWTYPVRCSNQAYGQRVRENTFLDDPGRLAYG